MTDAPSSSLSPRFWEVKTLSEMSQAEWEALCDGCGQCCVVLLDDEEAPEGTFYETNACCALFDPETRTCTDYERRQEKVPGCVKVSAQNASSLSWMPKSCAYRRLAEGRGLAAWHPLVSGRRNSVVEAGVAVSPELMNEALIPEDVLWDYVVGIRRV
ncbi:MAG: YcgN family cysteine cluster protein [Pseudomonadota bacterium]